jgi:hypothetical protein
MVPRSWVGLWLIPLCLLGVRSEVRADTIVQMFIVPQQDTNIATSFTVNQFQPLLGTLTSVTFEISGFFTSQLFASIQDSSGLGTQTPSNQVDGLFDLRRPDNPLVSVVSVPQTLSHSATLGPGDYMGCYPAEYNDPMCPPDSADALHYNIIPAISNVQNSFTTTNPADLALFTGVGNLLMDFFADAMDQNDPGGGLPTIQFNFTQAAATVQVTYEFEPAVVVVPEPMSLWMLGLGGTILLGRAVRRGRRALHSN